VFRLPARNQEMVGSGLIKWQVKNAETEKYASNEEVRLGELAR
jgi:hypothetical protein